MFNNSHLIFVFAKLTNRLGVCSGDSRIDEISCEKSKQIKKLKFERGVESNFT